MQQYELAKIIMDNLNFTCYITDLENGDLLYINKPFEGDLARIFHQGNRQGNKCYKFLDDCKRTCISCQSINLLKGKRVRKEIYDAATKKYYTQIDTLIEINNKAAKLVVIYDPALTHDDVESIVQKLTLEETLVSCVYTLVEDSEIEKAIHTLLKIVANYYGTSRSYVYELDPKQEIVSKIHEYNAEQLSTHYALNQGIPVAEFSPVVEVLTEKGEFALGDLEELDPNSALYAFFKHIHVNSLLLVPFAVDGKLTYCMGVDAPTKNVCDLRLLHSVVLFVVDRIRKSKIHEQLLNLSYSDILTGLWNRNKYNERFEELAEAEINDFGYVYIGLNHLRDINELYGEKYGDEILQKTAKLLRRHLGTDIFRMAGNEFVALCPHTPLNIFNDMLFALKSELKEHKDFSLSVGALHQSKKIDLRKGLSQSFDIMFAEKQKTYKSCMDNGVQSRQNPVQIVLDELQSGCFTIYLQPKVNLQTEEITSAEALVRKFDKNGKMISPEKFIPVYENEGTIRHVDFFVLEEVCKMLQGLMKRGKAFKVSVNFSRVTFLSTNLLEEVVATCAKYGIPHEYIKIEITESIDKMDFTFFDKKLKKIKNAGFEISLDDFGAKYSNLLMLTMTEFSEVKIDKGLIDYITQSAQNRALVKNILKMITDLGTSICVAEGIETKEQKEMILDFGCAYGQGYYFYQPMPVEEFLLEYEINIQKNLLVSAVKKRSLMNFHLSYNEMSSIIEAMPFCMIILDETKKVLSCNQCALDTYGISTKEEFLPRLFSLSPEYQPNGANSLELSMAYLNEAYIKGYLCFPWVHRTNQGKEFLAEVTLKRLKVKGSEDAPLMAAFVREITSEAMSNSTDWTQSYGFNNDVSDRVLIANLLDLSNEWLWTFDYQSQQMMFFGEGFEMYGLPKEKFTFPDTFLEKNLVYEEDLDYFMTICENLAKGEHGPCELRFNLPNGAVRYFKIVYRVIKNQVGEALTAVGKVIDVDKQKTFSLFTKIDDFTGCYNELTTKMLIDECLEAEPDLLHALFIVDVGKFKTLNGLSKYSFDDSVLVNVASGLLASFREEDIVGRVGKSMFAVFLKDTPHRDVIKEKMKLVESIMLESYDDIKQEKSAQACIGLAIYSQEKSTCEQLFSAAQSDIS